MAGGGGRRQSRRDDDLTFDGGGTVDDLWTVPAGVPGVVEAGTEEQDINPGPAVGL
jgi:hypothetical protein